MWMESRRERSLHGCLSTSIAPSQAPIKTNRPSCRSQQAGEKSGGRWRFPPHRLKPNSIQSIYVRPEESA